MFWVIVMVLLILWMLSTLAEVSDPESLKKDIARQTGKLFIEEK